MGGAGWHSSTSWSSSSLAMVLYCREEEGGREGENQQTNSLRSESRAWRGGGGARRGHHQGVWAGGVENPDSALRAATKTKR